MAVSRAKAPRVAVVTQAGPDDHSFPRDSLAGRAGQAVGPEPRRSPVIRGLFTPAEEGKPTLGIDRSCRTLPSQAHPFARPARGKPARFMT